MLNAIGGSWVKSALVTWLHIGTKGMSKRRAQRIVLTNVMTSVTAGVSYFYVLFFVLYDFHHLLWPVIFLVPIATALLATPFLNKIHPYLGSVYNLVLWLIYGCMLAITFGAVSGVHFAFLAGVISALLIMGIHQNPLSVVSSTVQLGLFVYFDRAMLPPASYLQLPSSFYDILYFSSVLLSILFIFFMVYYAFYQAHLAEDALEREYKYSEKLLTNMLPASIATELKRNPGRTIAENHDDVTILFADIVGFTPRAKSQDAGDLVTFLNGLFTRFDRLVHKHGLEKIKTIGDAFMVAGGLTVSQSDHLMRVAQMAMDMMAETKDYAKQIGEHLELRIGLHTGPVVAGVIGTDKPFYDVWGDTVNTAARLETCGTNGEIQVTAETKARLENSLAFTRRGMVDIKGKGELDLWYLRWC
ncbi:MAG: adenylate/guanylate cyclase domain-containing protein [Rhodobacterales bacterium]